MGDSDFSGWFVAPRTNLSPFAQAIWDALDMGDLNGPLGPQHLVALAYAVAVLHAAADQIVPSKQTYDAASHELRGSTVVSTLPGIDRWPEFARLTWIATGGTVAPFDPYDFQIDLIEQIYSHQNVIVNKSRQVGVSTKASLFATVCLHGMSYAANELRAIATELEGVNG